MEFAPAGDLSSFLKPAAASKLPLPEATVWQIFLQLCQGMQVRTQQAAAGLELAAAGRRADTHGRGWSRQQQLVLLLAGWVTLTCCAVLAPVHPHTGHPRDVCDPP